VFYIDRIEISATNEEVWSGAFTGRPQRHIIDGGVTKLGELATDPPEGCMVVQAEWTELELKLSVLPNGPDGLRNLANALEAL
jgi:hypothetical protein